MSTPAALAEILAGRPAPAGLAAAVSAISTRYHTGIADTAPALRSDLDREAYVAARMPATSAAVARALRLGDGAWTDSVHSVLDLGSGPGSALWAVADGCALHTITALERDAGLITLGRELALEGPDPLPQTTWIAGDLRALPPLDRHDLVVLSYAGNELTAADRAALITRAWELARVGLLLVEPGSRAGAAMITAARSQLLAHGATIAAPCTHHAACPLAESSDWCHQRVRLSRSRLHRLAKDASRGFEDEPFAFLLALRESAPRGGGRVIGSPQVTAAAVTLPLCSAAGYHTTVIARRDPAYRKAAKARWGDHHADAGTDS